MQNLQQKQRAQARVITDNQNAVIYRVSLLSLLLSVCVAVILI
ncbi:hypothetical protein [Fangia hongkongensis]|nr:hypothetical protein [Fangia hongkongensis]